MLNACSDTDEAPGNQEKNRVMLELRPYAPSFLDVEPIKTRAFPQDFSGYYPYDDNHVSGQFTPQRTIQDKTIHVLFFNQTATGTLAENLEEGTFYKSGANWRSLVEMETDPYYLFGYIPYGVASGVEDIDYRVDGDLSKGIKFTIKKLSSVTPSDVCVIVAAGRGNDSGPDEGFALGKFSYQAKQSEEQNYVYLLFDHIYASICFSFKVDAEYDKLRTIKIKKLRLLSSSMTRYVDAKITLYGNDDGVSPLRNTSVEFTDNGTDTADGVNDGLLFDETKGNVGPIVLSPDEPSDFLGCFVPGEYDPFTLETTFDVYDKKGNRVRKDCVATNSIKPSSSIKKRGTMLKLTLTVNPTYLYVLSEPDLDNPTVVENE